MAGYMVGAAGYILGLGLSVLFDLPSGAVVVWTLAATGAAAYAMGPGRNQQHQTRIFPD